MERENVKEDTVALMMDIHKYNMVKKHMPRQNKKAKPSLVECIPEDSLMMCMDKLTK